MDFVHGIISIRFAEVLVRCLCFPLSTYVIHAVSENHFKLGTWAQNTGKLWGRSPHSSLKIKRFKPSLLPAFREQQGGKKKRKAWGLCPQTPNQDVGWSQWRDGRYRFYKPPTLYLFALAIAPVPGPDQWAHRTPDATQAGDTPTARKHPGQLQA